jgi:hypothetical protein
MEGLLCGSAFVGKCLDVNTGILIIHLVVFLGLHGRKFSVSFNNSPQESTTLLEDVIMQRLKFDGW